MNSVRGALLLLLAGLPAAAQLSQSTPEVIRVNDHVYCATGFALGNVIFVLTDRSVVVVDTTEGQAPARAAFEDFRKISTLPVSYIIYTHFHGDHINGAKVFAGPSTKVIAQENHAEELRKYRLMVGYNRRLNEVQWAADGHGSSVAQRWASICSIHRRAVISRRRLFSAKSTSSWKAACALSCIIRRARRWII
jgi:glyoxylase-like metal-dependent hydrolase (beta-lactamase superfamily II)